MAIRNPQSIQTGRRNAEFFKDYTPFEREMADLNRIMPPTEKELRRIVGPEYDNYTPSQKEFAEELYERRNLFFEPDGKPRGRVFGRENRRFANETFDDNLLGEMIRDGAPLYLTPGTVAEGTVNRELRDQTNRDAYMEMRPLPDTYYERQRDEAEKNLPSEVDDFSGYAEGMNRIETELDPTSPNFRQGLNEGGTAAKNFFVSQKTYTPEEYEGYVNFFGGSLGSGIDVETVAEKEEKKAPETTNVLDPVRVDDPTEKAPLTNVFSLGSGKRSAYDVKSYSYGDNASDFPVDFTKFQKAGTQDLSDSFVTEYMDQVRAGVDVKKEVGLAPISATMGAVAASTAGTLMGKSVPVPFGKEESYRPSGLPGFAFDMAMVFHSKNAAAVGAVQGKAGALMLVNNMLVSRKPGDYRYTGNLGGLTREQMFGIEATKEGFISGTMKDVYDEETNTWTKTGMKGLLDGEAAFRVGGNVSETGYFISVFGGGAKLTGNAGLENDQFAAAYEAANRKYGVSIGQFRQALEEAQSKAGFFGTVRGKHRNATFLSDALDRMQNMNQAAQQALAQEREEAAQQQMRDIQSQAGAAADAAAQARRQENEDDNEPLNRGNEYGFDSSQSFGVGASGGMSGALARGGRVGLQEGGEAMAPAGFVAGPPGEFTDRQKVADDQNMQVEEGTFVINAAAVEEAGSEDIKNMILKAYSVAREQGVFEVDRPLYEKAVDVAVSKGEVIVPPQLARIIGYDRLRKINNRGKKETEERIEETGQNPQGGFLGGIFGKKKDEDLVETFTPPSEEELRSLNRESTPMPLQEKGREIPDEGFVAAKTRTSSTPLPPRTDFENLVTDLLQRVEENELEGYVPSNNSGVTIGRGFDIGQHNATDLVNMGIDTSLISRLTPYLKKKGQAARDALAYEKSQGRGLKFSPQEAVQLEELNLTVQRAKYRAFEQFMKDYKLKMPEDPVDRAALFSEFYVGNFKTAKNKGTGKRELSIRKSFMNEVQKSGNVFYAFQVGVLDRLSNSRAARPVRTRTKATMDWILENKPSANVPIPTSKPKKSERKGFVPTPTSKPKRDSSATRGIRP